MRWWLKWPLLIIIGALWGVAISILGLNIEILRPWGSLPFYIFTALCIPFALEVYLLHEMAPHLERSFNAYLWQSDYTSMSVLIPAHIVNVLIIYLVVAAVRWALARRMSKREPGPDPFAPGP